MENIQKIIENRPWGKFTQFTKNTPSTVKIIEVKAGEELSLQKHSKRSEFWHILEGSGIVKINETTTNTKIGDEFFIPVSAKHRISATENLVFLEIAFGDFDEQDIIRFEDKYNRTSN